MCGGPDCGSAIGVDETDCCSDTIREFGTSCDVSESGPCIIAYDTNSSAPTFSPFTSTTMTPTAGLLPSELPSVSHTGATLFPTDTVSPINGAPVESAGAIATLAAMACSLFVMSVLARH